MLLLRMSPMYVLRRCTTLSQSLIRHAIFWAKPPQQANCLAPLWKYRRKLSFPTMHRPIQEPYREPPTL